MSALSFETNPEFQGQLASLCVGPDTNILADGVVVGTIISPTTISIERLWKIEFAVAGEPAAKMISLKGRFETDESAKLWVAKRWNAINTMYKLVDIAHVDRLG